MQSIHVRPPEIEDRLIPGHWEGDLIKGAGNRSSVGTLVERTRDFVVLAKMSSASAADALRQYLPKGTDLSVYSQTELNQIALSLNTRPRKRHQFRTPLEVYNDHLRFSEASAGTIH